MFYSRASTLNSSPSPEQTELKRSARRFLAAHCASAQVRAVVDTERGWDDAAWKRACELGWPALAAVGGLELALVTEETGRALAPLPFFSSVCLGAGALLAAGAAGHAARVESGEVRATFAHAGEVRAARVEGGWALSGAARFVVDGHTADLLVVRALDPEPALFVVAADAAGVSRVRTPALDPTRALATVTFADVRLPAAARVGDGAAAQRAIDHAAIALAAESLGAAERCLDEATEYARTRVQFDRPIGSFQAIKHKLADMLVWVETARSAVYWAAGVAGTGDDAERATAAAIAKSHATEAFFRCAAECLQVHGGIGFTWEHDAHLFLKRARTSLSLLGTPDDDRERIAREVLDAP